MSRTFTILTFEKQAKNMETFEFEFGTINTLECYLERIEIARSQMETEMMAGCQKNALRLYQRILNLLGTAKNSLDPKPLLNKDEWIEWRKEVVEWANSHNMSTLARVVAKKRRCLESY